jgi:hypothetical protein
MLTIDLHKINQLQLTVGEYFYLMGHLVEGIDLTINVDKLKEKGYIDEFNSISDEIANVIFPEKEINFDKIYDLYPHKVGTRVLKSLSNTSAIYNYCLNKYNQYLKKDPLILSKMHKGLTNELILMKKGNSEKYFQDITTWFNQRTWEKYCDFEIDAQEDERVDVG